MEASAFKVCGVDYLFSEWVAYYLGLDIPIRLSFRSVDDLSYHYLLAWSDG